ncbi:MAG: hypothetical protein AAB400_01115 [Patescibacteria group bacterium]
MKQKFLRFVSKAAMFTASTGLVFSSLAPMAAHAAVITSMKDQMSRIQETVTSDHTFTITTATAWNEAAANTIIFKFEAGFLAGGATSTWSTDDFRYDGFTTADSAVTAVNAVVDTALETGDFPTCGSGVIVAVAQTVNDSTGSVREIGFRKCTGATTDAVGAQIFYIYGGTAAHMGSGTGTAGTITNPSAGSKTITITQGAAVAATDSGSMVLTTVSDDTAGASGTVSPYLTATISAPSASLTLTQDTVGTASGGSVTIDTNAPTGYVFRIHGTGNGTGVPGNGTGGLYASSLTGTGGTGIVTSATVADGSVAGTATGYGLSATRTGEATTVETNYSHTNATTTGWGAVSTSWTDVVTQTAEATNDVVTITFKAKVDYSVSPGTYSDTVYYNVYATF